MSCFYRVLDLSDLDLLIWSCLSFPNVWRLCLIEAWCVLHKKQGEKGRCWLYSHHTSSDRFPFDTVCPQLNDTAFVHYLFFFFLNPSPTWGCQPLVLVWFIILSHTCPWFQPQWVALFLLVIKDIITMHFFFSPANMSRPILKLRMAFWHDFYWKNTVQMTKNFDQIVGLIYACPVYPYLFFLKCFALP